MNRREEIGKQPRNQTTSKQRTVQRTLARRARALTRVHPPTVALKALARSEPQHGSTAHVISYARTSERIRARTMPAFCRKTSIWLHNIVSFSTVMNGCRRL